MTDVISDTDITHLPFRSRGTLRRSCFILLASRLVATLIQDDREADRAADDVTIATL